jgi:DNA-binding NarL/FixJ family response regulator
MRIVIVDDSEILRDRLKIALDTIKDVEIVGEAQNGLEALQVIKDYNPDFLILDIRMPEMNGITVLKKIREQGLKTKVCVFTNYPYLQYKEKCLAEGADYFIDKNEDINVMINILDKEAHRSNQKELWKN